MHGRRRCFAESLFPFWHEHILWSHFYNKGAGPHEDGHGHGSCCSWNIQAGTRFGLRTYSVFTVTRRSSSVAFGQGCQRMSSCRTRLATSETGVADTEPSELWSSRESDLNFSWTCWHIPHSHQSPNSFNWFDARHTSAASDHLTRCVGSQSIHRAQRHSCDTIRVPSATKVQKGDSAAG